MTSENYDPAANSGAVHLQELERMFKLGNKIALYDAITVSRAYNLPLPEWAVVPLQEAVVKSWAGKLNAWKGCKGGYRDLLAKHVRAMVYRSVIVWMENDDRLKDMPTACIEQWKSGKWKSKPKNSKQAVSMAIHGLKGTFAICSEATFRKQMYTGGHADVKKVTIDNAEAAEALDLDGDEYAKFVKSQIMEFRSLPLPFGDDDSEIKFGLRNGQFWGPPE